MPSFLPTFCGTRVTVRMRTVVEVVVVKSLARVRPLKSPEVPEEEVFSCLFKSFLTIQAIQSNKNAVWQFVSAAVETLARRSSTGDQPSYYYCMSGGEEEKTVGLFVLAPSFDPVFSSGQRDQANRTQRGRR